MKAFELRQSIMSAALSGKLVPQNLKEEPAHKLLDRIKKRRDKLLSQGYPNKSESIHQRRKQLQQIIPDDLPDIPDGWMWCTLMQCAELVVDCHNKTAPYQPDGIPLIRTSNIRNGQLLLSGVKFIDEPTYEKWSARCLPEANDILITREAPMGEVCLIPEGLNVCMGQRIMLLRLFPDCVFPRFMLYSLRDPQLMDRVQDKPIGSTVQHLRVGGIETLLVPLPPFAEQQRIVEKLDGLMALCDELEVTEKELDKLQASFADNLPKSILQAAVQGKLVPQNIRDEPATALLERICTKKKQLIKDGKLKKEKLLPPITEDEIPYDLPDVWEWCRLGEIANVNPRNNLPDDLEVSFIPMTLISQEYFGGHQQETRFWSKIKSGYTHFAEGDIAMAKITPCFENGKSCVMNELISGYGAGTTELHIIRGIEVLPEYILIFVKTPEFLFEGAKNMTGTAGQQRIPVDYLRNCLFPLPPLAEQQRIVTKVDELMAICDEMKGVQDMPIETRARDAVIIDFPQPKQEKTLLAARGDVGEGLSHEAQQAIDDLFAEDE